MLLMSISVIFVCSFYFFPESPAYLKKWRMGTVFLCSTASVAFVVCHLLLFMFVCFLFYSNIICSRLSQNSLVFVYTNLPRHFEFQLLTKSNEFYYGSEAATGDDFEDGIYLNRSVITPNLTETNDTSTRQNLREFRKHY